MMTDPEREGGASETDREPLLPAPAPEAERPSGPEPLRITTRTVCGTTVLTAVGDLDLATGETFEEGVARCLAANPTTLVLDLTAVTFMGTAGLAALVKAEATAGPDCRLKVVAASRITLRPLQVTELDQMLAIYPTLDAALVDVESPDTA